MIKNLVIPGPDGEANLEIPSALDVNDPFESQAPREAIIHLELEPKTVRALKNVLYFIGRESELHPVPLVWNDVAYEAAASARMHLLEYLPWDRLYFALVAAGERTTWDHNDYDF